MISGVNYLHLCKNWIFDVIWPHRPFYDLILIKCNVPDLASLGNTANVCVGSKVYNI
jgi:hypothetical protein